MASKSKATGTGIRANDVTSSLNKHAFVKTMRTVDLCDAYRKYLKIEPLITFSQFKELKKKKKLKKN
jgi:hypothetical protein